MPPSVKPRLLIVDDEPDILRSLERTLRRDYDVYTATSGEAALELLAAHQIPILLADQRMPGMTGVELLAQAYQIAPLTVGILLTGYADIEVVVDAINLGHVYKYFAKPWDLDILREELDAAWERYDLERQRREELERLNGELEGEVVSRTAVIRDQNVRLQELDWLRSRFLANVSHQLRTPLHVIRTYAELARDGPLHKRDHYLEQVVRAESQLEQIVVSILGFADLSLTKGELKPEPIDLQEFVSETVAARKPMAQERLLQLEFTPMGGRLQVTVDVALMRKALGNVIVNALLYTPAGGAVQVWTEPCGFDRLSAPEQDAVATFVAIRVRDTGPGIPEMDLPYLFEPFVRGTEQDSGHIAGVGLGLPIAARIMGWHEGRITVRSAVGEGSTFSLLLPCIQEDMTAGAAKP